MTEDKNPIDQSIEDIGDQHDHHKGAYEIHGLQIAPQGHEDRKRRHAQGGDP